MIDKCPIDVMDARRRKLDELFADQPYLSPTMRASSLHDLGLDELPPLRIPVDDDDDMPMRLVRLHETEPTVLAPFAMEAVSLHVAPVVRTPPVAVPNGGEVRLELVLDVNAAQHVLSARIKPMEPEVMTVAEAARYLRISESTVRHWVRDEGMPSAQVGRRRRFRRDALLAWLESREKHA